MIGKIEQLNRLEDIASTITDEKELNFSLVWQKFVNIIKKALK